MKKETRTGETLNGPRYTRGRSNLESAPELALVRTISTNPTGRKGGREGSFVTFLGRNKIRFKEVGSIFEVLNWTVTPVLILFVEKESDG